MNDARALGFPVLRAISPFHALAAGLATPRAAPTVETGAETQTEAAATQNNANHIHTVWRDHPH